MSVFNEYARYYDLLYRDKDYGAETDYIHNLIQKQNPGCRTILNLGCGSGRHDRCLVERGYAVTGVDLSEEMLTAARCAVVASRTRPVSRSNTAARTDVTAFGADGSRAGLRRL